MIFKVELSIEEWAIILVAIEQRLEQTKDMQESNKRYKELYHKFKNQQPCVK